MKRRQQQQTDIGTTRLLDIVFGPGVGGGFRQILTLTDKGNGVLPMPIA